ncbi:MAG: type I 3-dehydroquinate dehydratase [Ramlibacter sp.]
MQSWQPKAISLDGKRFGSGNFPAICAPLVGRTREKLLAEVAVVATKKPDIIEWRVDFFDGIADTAQVVDIAGHIRGAAGGAAILFTRRSMREGGERIALTEPQVVALYRAVCESGHVDMVDFEMSSEPDRLAEVREFSRARGVKLVLSFHDFKGTPSLDELDARFAQAESLGADVAKIAVMPRDMDDVLTLLSATLRASCQLEIPVVSMSMGPHGAITRLCGWAFGSAMSFGVGESSSAPGQMPIEDLAAGLEIARRALG